MVAIYLRMVFFAFLLVFVPMSNAWLDEYFSNTNDEHVKIDVIKKLMECGEDAEQWEEAVRNRKMTAALCSLNDVMKKCTYSLYQDPTAQYIKFLIEDAHDLCPESCSENWFCTVLKVLFFIDVFVCLVQIGVWLSRRVRQKIQKKPKPDNNDSTELCKEGGTDAIEYPLPYP